MPDDFPDPLTDEEKAAFLEYRAAMQRMFKMEELPLGRSLAWKAIRLVGLPLPESEDALDDLLRAAFDEC